VILLVVLSVGAIVANIALYRTAAKTLEQALTDVAARAASGSPAEGS